MIESLDKNVQEFIKSHSLETGMEWLLKELHKLGPSFEVRLLFPGSIDILLIFVDSPLRFDAFAKKRARLFSDMKELGYQYLRDFIVVLNKSFEQEHQCE